MAPVPSGLTHQQGCSRARCPVAFDLRERCFVCDFHLALIGVHLSRPPWALWSHTVPPTNAILSQMQGAKHLSMLGRIVFFIPPDRLPPGRLARRNDDPMGSIGAVWA